ncbi:depupylase/deamidase Dop [Ruania alba]|uniref:Proteasome accessory factor A n=1 Tax=Ruania alba TaxID=648782 RepID=A0A1H5GM23_9MICO|nr:depupylase/deamidase Dop [Ruania alba]SEE16767.1 proteasome accessory factor A [Ruania alba]
MSVRRVMGIETEYGLLGVGNPGANPMLMSAQLVTAYANEGMPAAARARWDYQDEDPLCDARGFRLDRAAADPSLLTDDPLHPAPEGDLHRITLRRRPSPQPEQATVANVILPNGARYYVDHAHPEYSSPEVTTPRDAVLWDRAGEEVLLRSARLLAQIAGMPDVALYKNNTDGKGASYGTHENYLVDRAVPFEDIIAALTPFLVTRPVFCGAGRLGRGQRGQTPGYQLSQRADFIEAEVGLETTLRRPIINTRDEPHAQAGRYRRLHVIVGDANLLEMSTYLKVGTTSLLLWLLEQGSLPLELAALRLADPVEATHEVSHDLSLTRELELDDGRRMTALEIQRAYCKVLTTAVREQADRTGITPDDQTVDVLDRWSDLLTRLGSDPTSCAREVEWLAKLRVMEAMRRRDGLGWDSPRLAATDLQWSDLRPERSIYGKLRAAGAVERVVTEDEVDHAVLHPPTNTRAYFRGEAVRRYPGAVAAASWDAIVFDVEGAPALQRVPMSDPHRGTREHVGALLDQHPDAASLLAALTAPQPPDT